MVRRWSMGLVFLVIGLLAGALTTPRLAYGRDAKEQQPRLKESKPAVEWAIGAVFLVGSLVVAFKNSRRSHLG